MIKKNGFTLIEVLISLFIVVLAILLISKTIISSIYVYQDSLQRFNLLNIYTNCKNELISKPFDSEDLKAGEYSLRKGLINLQWKITNFSSVLKKIELKVWDKKRSKKGYFINSYLLKRRHQ